MDNNKSGLSTAGLVLGIVGICTSFIPIINNLSFVMALLAIIFGIISLVKKSKKGKVIASIVLGVLTIIITINAQQALSNSIDEAVNTFNEDMDKATGNSTEDVLNNYVDVNIGNFQVIDGEYYSETKLVVKLTNKTSETRSFNIQIEAVDSNGTRLNQDYIFANSLSAGQSQDFEIFTLTPSDKIDSMRNATFKIVEASTY